MKEFVSLTINNDTPHALYKYLSYDYLSPFYTNFISEISFVPEPATYEKPSKTNTRLK